MKNISKDDITAVILSGGRAKRMNGQDKGLIVFNDKPLISYVADVVREKSACLFISANRNIEAYGQYGTVITDDLIDFQGPLAGISKALTVSKTAYLLVLPCDSPLINVVLIDRFIESMNHNTVDICVAYDGVQMHPAMALIKCSLKHNLLDFLALGERKLGLWIEQNNFIKVDFSDCPEVLTNFNRASDFVIFNPNC